MKNNSKVLNRIDIDSIIPNESIIPIAIPSYKRPEARLLKTLSSTDYPGRVMVFVRKEELKSYKSVWGDRFEFVPLRGVRNLGETRAEMVNWCLDNDISEIIMMDDDITAFDYMVKGCKKNGEPCLKTYQNSVCEQLGVNPTAIKLWQLYLKEAKENYPIALSSVAYRTYSWHYDNTKKPWSLNDGYCNQVFYLDLELLKENSINYVSSDVCFNEDKYMQYQVMSSGLYSLVFNEFSYSVSTAGHISDGSGCAEMYGCQNGYSEERLFTAYKNGTKKFIKNVLNEEDNHRCIRKVNRQGMYEIKFVWKHWRKPYEVQKSEVI